MLINQLELQKLFKKHREMKGWTQKQAADRLGISRTYLSTIESLKRKRGLNLPYSTISKFFEIFEIPLEEFDQETKKAASALSFEKHKDVDLVPLMRIVVESGVVCRPADLLRLLDAKQAIESIPGNIHLTLGIVKEILGQNLDK